MIQKLESTKAYNHHDSLVGSYKRGVTYPLTIGNIVCRSVGLERDHSGLFRCTWKQFIIKFEASLHIVNLYHPVHPAPVVSPRSVYDQHLANFSNIKRK